eukprot:TRINITY_DN6129_c0_g1_i3.p1 TRINITY_DN6129_c0_g1~~TRINITY_DN6129_c0_g1_i3.p1  ORF type:complete len:275 (-),score=79.88 TRINITY_DN6129_c0_g1_i3:167-991(-)
MEDQLSQDEQTQKRYRFLSHLPLSCNFEFCVMDISSYLSPSLYHPWRETTNRWKKKWREEEEQKLSFERKVLKQQAQEQQMTMTHNFSQVRLYERLSNLESVENNEMHFPSLPADGGVGNRVVESCVVGLMDQGLDASSTGSSTGSTGPTGQSNVWANSVEFRNKLEILSNPVKAQEQQFPQLSTVSTVPLEQPKGVWGKTGGGTVAQIVGGTGRSPSVARVTTTPTMSTVTTPEMMSGNPQPNLAGRVSSSVGSVDSKRGKGKGRNKQYLFTT